MIVGPGHCTAPGWKAALPILFWEGTHEGHIDQVWLGLRPLPVPIVGSDTAPGFTVAAHHSPTGLYVFPLTSRAGIKPKGPDSTRGVS